MSVENKLRDLLVNRGILPKEDMPDYIEVRPELVWDAYREIQSLTKQVSQLKDI